MRTFLSFIAFFAWSSEETADVGRLTDLRAAQWATAGGIRKKRLYNTQCMGLPK